MHSVQPSQTVSNLKTIKVEDKTYRLVKIFLKVIFQFCTVRDNGEMILSKRQFTYFKKEIDKLKLPTSFDEMCKTEACELTIELLNRYDKTVLDMFLKDELSQKECQKLFSFIQKDKSETFTPIAAFCTILAILGIGYYSTYYDNGDIEKKDETMINSKTVLICFFCVFHLFMTTYLTMKKCMVPALKADSWNPIAVWKLKKEKDELTKLAPPPKCGLQIGIPNEFPSDFGDINWLSAAFSFLACTKVLDDTLKSVHKPSTRKEIVRNEIRSLVHTLRTKTSSYPIHRDIIKTMKSIQKIPNYEKIKIAKQNPADFILSLFNFLGNDTGIFDPIKILSIYFKESKRTEEYKPCLGRMDTLKMPVLDITIPNEIRRDQKTPLDLSRLVNDKKKEKLLKKIGKVTLEKNYWKQTYLHSLPQEFIVRIQRSTVTSESIRNCRRKSSKGALNLFAEKSVNPIDCSKQGEVTFELFDPIYNSESILHNYSKSGNTMYKIIAAIERQDDIWITYYRTPSGEISRYINTKITTIKENSEFGKKAELLLLKQTKI